MSEDYKVQASFKFGRGQEGMLNVRAASVDELDGMCRHFVEEALGSVLVLAEALRAESLVRESFPGTTRVDSQGNPAPTGQGAPSAAASGTPTCDHGFRVKRSGGLGREAWEGWFCPLDKSHPERCKPIYPNKR